MSANEDQPKPNWIKRIEQVYQSRLVLGALVALLVMANGFVT